MVDQIVPNGYDGHIGVVVFVNGRILPKAEWRYAPLQTDVVNIRVIPAGGGGGKNPLVMVLSIAVMVAAPMVGAALANVAGFGGLWVGSTYFSSAAIYGAAFSVLGRLAISALAPPPVPSNQRAGSVSNPATSPTQFIQGARNVLDPFGIVPVCLGTNRMFPPQAARPFTESEGRDQYVRQLFTWGFGDEVAISNLRIGETPLAQFSGVDLEHKLNGNLNEGTGIFSNSVIQEDFNISLLQADGYSIRTTQPDADEAIVDIAFPQGLVRFNDQGKRRNRTVEVEAQISPAGQNQWSPSGTGYSQIDAKSFSFPASDGDQYRYLIVINKFTGTISSIRGDRRVVPSFSGPGSVTIWELPATPSWAYRLAEIQTNSSGEVTEVKDVRSAARFGQSFEDSDSFVPSIDGNNVLISAGGFKNTVGTIRTARSPDALRYSIRIKLPETGQYDVRVRRVTSDSTSDRVRDLTAWVALKTVRYVSPVNAKNVNGTALRIKGSDQLNGAVEIFNGDATSVLLDWNGTEWVKNLTSNPASIYRYVLQGALNARALSDDEIDLDALQDWHEYCEDQGYTYNRVIDYETSVDDALRDVAAAGSASPSIVDGKRSVSIDRIKEDIVQIITPRNSWGYSGELIYPEIPHAFRVQFRNAERGYLQDERIVYDDGFNAMNATRFETLEIQSCTNSALAFLIARRHLAAIRLRPESHTFNMDVEHLVAKRGDRVKFYNDVPLLGVGDARIKEVVREGSPEVITGIALDDTIAIPASGTYYVRIRSETGEQFYKEIIAPVGQNTFFEFAEPFVENINKGDLCGFVEAGKEHDLIITRIESTDDFGARITAVDYAPGIWTAESAPIPAFQSNVTIPLEFIRPKAPILKSEQSGTDVLQVNSDGSYITRAVFSFENQNAGEVSLDVLLRPTGTSQFVRPDILESSPEGLVITGLDDGQRYDINIRYRRAGTNTVSPPLQLNNYLFIGTSGNPSNVQNFKISVIDDVATFKWDKVPDIDKDYYQIRFSPLFSGSTWGTSQIFESQVFENRLTAPFKAGTYLIKAVDLNGNFSDDPAVIITFDPGKLKNVVEILEEHPDFLGDKQNAIVFNNGLQMAEVDFLSSPPITRAIYQFDETVDLDAVYTSFVSSSVVAGGVFINNLFDIDDLFQKEDLFGSGNINLFDTDDLFEEEDLFGIGLDAWNVEIQFRKTNQDTTASPEWTEWEPLEAGNLEFRGIQFRLVMDTFQENVTPRITFLSAIIDMPDRIERGEALTVPIGGINIAHDPEFKIIPSVAITLQNADADDEVEFTSKTTAGFGFKVYNKTLDDYVSRTFDYIASGFGRRE